MVKAVVTRAFMVAVAIWLGQVAIAFMVAVADHRILMGVGMCRKG